MNIDTNEPKSIQIQIYQRVYSKICTKNMDIITWKIIFILLKHTNTHF